VVGEDLRDEVNRDVLLTLDDYDVRVGQGGGHGVDAGLEEVGALSSGQQRVGTVIFAACSGSKGAACSARDSRVMVWAAAMRARHAGRAR
jgi:hypothetical protein